MGERPGNDLQTREKEPPHSLKRRQLETIGASVKQLKEDCRSREEVRMAQFLEETKAQWIAVVQCPLASKASISSSLVHCNRIILETVLDTFFKYSSVQDNPLNTDSEAPFTFLKSPNSAMASK